MPQLPAELVEKFKASRMPTTPTPSPQPVEEGGRIVPDVVRNLLLGGSFVGAIPHPITRGIGALSSAGLAGVEGIEAARAAQRGDMGEAGMSAMFAALGGSGAIGFLRNLKSAAPTLANMVKPLEERAAKVAEIEELIKAAKKPTKAMQRSLASEQRLLVTEARRLFREQRLTARELRAQGQKIPKELQTAIRNAAKQSEAVGKAIEPMVAQPMKTAAARTAKAQKKNAEKLAATPKEVQRAEAAVTGLMRKANVPEKVIANVKKSLQNPKGKNVQRVSKKVFNELGASASEILMRMTAATGGAVVGGAVGANSRPEDAEKSKMAYALAGAGMGALAGTGLASIAMAGSKSKAIEKLTDFNYFSLLSAPGAVGKAALGSVSSMIVGAAIRMGEGRFADASRILKSALDDTAKGVFFKAIANPNRYIPAQVRQKARVPLKGGVLGYPTRVIAASDAVSSRALMSGGFSRAEALRFNLSGDPQTAVGRWFTTSMGLPVTRVMPNGRIKIEKAHKLTQNEVAQLALRFFVPFARVAVSIPERTLEFSPVTALVPKLQKTFGHQNFRETLTKAALGPLAGVAGGASTEFTTPDTDAITTALGGPMAGWVELGQQIARGAGRDRPLLSSANEALQNLPLIAEQVPITSPVERLIPAIFRDVARGVDPAFGRERGPATIAENRLREGGAPGFLGETLATIAAPIQARVPVLREALPERAMPVDVFGNAQYPDRPAFIPDVTLRGFGGQTKLIDITIPKVLTSQPLSNPSVFPRNNPTAQAVRDVQRKTMHMGEILAPPQVIESPALNEAMGLAGKDIGSIPRDIKRLAQRARGAPVETALSQVVSSPQFSSIPDEVKNVLLRRIVGGVRDQVGPAVGQAALSSRVAPDSQDAIRESLKAMIASFEQGRR